MSLLLESDISTAPFSVSATGVELATGATGDCCARTDCTVITATNIPNATICFEAMLLPPIRLLIAQRFDRLQRRRLLRRQPAEEKACRARNQKRQHHTHPRNWHAQISRQKLLDDHGNSHTDQDSNHCTAAADHKRFD